MNNNENAISKHFEQLKTIMFTTITITRCKQTIWCGENQMRKNVTL